MDGAVVAGEHTITFDGTDAQGHALSSGIYFLRMETPQIVQVKQVSLLK